MYDAIEEHRAGNPSPLRFLLKLLLDADEMRDFLALEQIALLGHPTLELVCSMGTAKGVEYLKQLSRGYVLDREELYRRVVERYESKL